MANGGATWQHKLETAVVQGIQGNLGSKSLLSSRCQRMHTKHLFILICSLTIWVACGIVVPDKYHHNCSGRTKSHLSSPVVIFYESLSIMEQLTVALANLNKRVNSVEEEKQPTIEVLHDLTRQQ